MSDDLLERLTAASYSDEEIQKLIPFIWELDEKHPTVWTALARRLIITLMRERMMEKR